MTAPLRARLVGALLAVVLLAVGTATALYLREVSSQLERQLTERADRALGSLQTELRQHEAKVASALDALVDDPRELARFGPQTPAGERYSRAAQRLRPGALDLLDVLDSQGITLSSAHWPTRIDLPQPPHEPTPDGAHVARIDGPEGPRPALILVREALVADQVLQVVGGRWLDSGDLVAARERLGVDQLELLWGDEAPQASPGRSLRQRRLRLPGADAPSLLVGVDRADVAALQRSLRWQALLVALLSALLALAVGMALSRGIVRPVEALARAASRLAGGDLDARVPRGSSRVREVEDLVGAFNAMGDDLAASRDELVQAERVAAWREIARGLAHELKNPLTPIRGAMDVIRRARSLDRPVFDEILHEQAEAVVSEVARLTELSDSFARFARLPDPRPEPLDIGALLDDAAALYAQAEGVTVVRAMGPAPVRADRNQLATVFTNLIKNACESMEDRGTLRLSAARRGDEVEIVVADDGPGIAPEVRDRLFTPYVTTKGSRGTGLGLAMAHRIVVEHGGRIEARDAEGGGAAFVIRLPADPAAP